MNITDEQQAIVESPARNLVVNAFAGTGKTTTLVAYAKRRPGKRFTYLAFNRSIKEEAAKKFPANVKCVTTHGLAFGTFGKNYTSKLGTARPFQVAEALNTSVLAAGKALEIVGRFLVSADPALHERHMVGTPYGMNEQGQLFDAATRLWARMQNISDAAVPMPHDGYLKLYQLSNPTIRSDIILFDECQDANPVTTSLVLAQPADKVMVGDAHQSIYSFRGAVNAMTAVRDAATLDLTKSFRFGPGVAEVATALLQDWKGERREIEGMGKHQTQFSVDFRAPHARLARTNGELFRSAVDALEEGRKFGYAGGVEGYRLDTILDAYRLYSGNRGDIRDPWIRAFDSFLAMRDYADQMDDKELKMLAGIADEYRNAIPSLVEQIKGRAVPPAQLTGKEIILATVHKAKGLEFDSVALLNDFSDLEVKKGEKGEEVLPDPEEINILYVAVTRAERCLSLNDKTLDWLSATGRSGMLKRSAKPGKARREESVIRPVEEGALTPKSGSPEFNAGLLRGLEILFYAKNRREAASKIVADGGSANLIDVARAAGRGDLEKMLTDLAVK